MTQQSPVTIGTQEVRLATTMTGGVSLAIWMGGVAREIDLVMQASRIRRAAQPNSTTSEPPEGLTNAEHDERDLYSRLLSLLDVVVEVDILSGTSAGGINAALLAYSRVRNGDLGALRSLWLDLGALLELLRNPTDSDVPSLLYGDRRMLKDLNERLPGLAPGPKEDDPPSTTLYITTTLLTGETNRIPDALGTVVQDHDQHGLFTFTEKQLAGDIDGALAVAARSTSSFPGAFEPSFVPFDIATPKAGEIPPRPAMRDYANITRNHWVADGGLLDNQPLDVLLQRVFDRRARRHVRRVLMFVVPSAGPAPDLSQAAPADDVAAPYGLLDGLLKDLGAATSQSISSSLRAIIAHNDRIAAQADMRAQLAEMGVRLRPEGRLLTGRLLDDYRARESERQTRKLVRAILRLLSTWAPQTSPKQPGIPAAWAPALGAGGDAERVCRIAVCSELTRTWPRALDASRALSDKAVPATATSFAAYGRTLYDDAKSLALGVLRLAYDVAVEQKDRTHLLTTVEHLHDDAPKADRPRPDALAREVFEKAVMPTEGDSPPLRAAAASLAQAWAARTSAAETEWNRLGEHLRAAASLIAKIAEARSASTSSDPACAGIATRSSAIVLRGYVGYLGLGDAATDAPTITLRLFDLAVCEQALLPVESGPYQPVELVQVSADTRGLLTPNNSTAASKLTGLQLHHFGAFYKKSWRANDWMWGRLDAAGWLVHALLDPRRLQVVAASHPANKVDWLLRELATFGATPLTDKSVPTNADVSAELAFLDNPAVATPSSLPITSMWLASAWQRRVAEDELPVLAAIIDGEPGEQIDRSPRESRVWARKVLQEGADLSALLKTCPVPKETFETDRGSPLMVRTLAKAAAATAAAVTSLKQVPGPVRPAITTAHTIALAGYRMANAAKGLPRNLILVGAVLLTLGIAAATRSSTLFGVSGLIMAGVGGYLLTFGAWQLSRRLIGALVAVTITAAIGSLANDAVRRGLFGTSVKDSGVVGRHVHWLATAWWHPLLVVGIVVLAITVVAAVFSRMGAPKRRSPS